MSMSSLAAGRRCLACFFLFLVTVGSAASEAVEPPSDLIGQAQLIVTDGETTLLDIARRADLGVLDIMAANPGLDPWVPGDGTSVLLPSVYLLPEAPREGLVINLAELRLYHFPGKGEAPRTMTIGIGREGFTTPLGETRIVRKQQDPTWYPTAATREDRPELPGAVPPGPDNPLGRHALYLGWDSYLIHGTNKPNGVGRRVSRGCIRLYPESVERLYGQVPVGTKVTVVSQSVKLGWHDGRLYVEAHPEIEQLDALEQLGDFPTWDEFEYDAAIVAKAGAAADRLDWPAIRATLRRRSGVPTPVSP